MVAADPQPIGTRTLSTRTLLGERTISSASCVPDKWAPHAEFPESPRGGALSAGPAVQFGTPG